MWGPLAGERAFNWSFPESRITLGSGAAAFFFPIDLGKLHFWGVGRKASDIHHHSLALPLVVSVLSTYILRRNPEAARTNNTAKHPTLLHQVTVLSHITTPSGKLSCIHPAFFIAPPLPWTVVAPRRPDPRRRWSTAELDERLGISEHGLGDFSKPLDARLGAFPLAIFTLAPINPVGNSTPHYPVLLSHFAIAFASRATSIPHVPTLGFSRPCRVTHFTDPPAALSRGMP